MINSIIYSKYYNKRSMIISFWKNVIDYGNHIVEVQKVLLIRDVLILYKIMYKIY